MDIAGANLGLYRCDDPAVGRAGAARCVRAFNFLLRDVLPQSSRPATATGKSPQETAIAAHLQSLRSPSQRRFLSPHPRLRDMKGSRNFSAAVHSDGAAQVRTCEH
jgi:hypothetical protein